MLNKKIFLIINSLFLMINCHSKINYNNDLNNENINHKTIHLSNHNHQFKQSLTEEIKTIKNEINKDEKIINEIKERESLIAKIKAKINKQATTSIINNDYQQYLNEYNLLVNYHGDYQKQLINCQVLINEMTQVINEINNNEIINNYQHLIRRINHKQQWLTNNHLGYGYWTISITQITLNFFMLICFLFWYSSMYDYLKKSEIINLICCSLFHELARSFDEKKPVNAITFIVFFGYFLHFLLFFITNSLNNSENYLANSIHYLFTKYSFNNNYSLPKQQACYFYYDHSTKTIINDEKYFTVPFLFTNNNHLITNLFDIIVNLFNLMIISLILRQRFFVINNNNLWNWKPIRLMILLFIFMKLFLLINVIFIHVHALGENNPLNQFKLKITNFFKSLPVINKFYYQSKKKNNYLISILSIIILIIVSMLIDYCICRLKKIKTFWLITTKNNSQKQTPTKGKEFLYDKPTAGMESTPIENEMLNNDDLDKVNENLPTAEELQRLKLQSLLKVPNYDLSQITYDKVCLLLTNEYDIEDINKLDELEKDLTTFSNSLKLNPKNNEEQNITIFVNDKIEKIKNRKKELISETKTATTIIDQDNVDNLNNHNTITETKTKTITFEDNNIINDNNIMETNTSKTNDVNIINNNDKDDKIKHLLTSDSLSYEELKEFLKLEFETFKYEEVKICYERLMKLNSSAHELGNDERRLFEKQKIKAERIIAEYLLTSNNSDQKELKEFLGLRLGILTKEEVIRCHNKLLQININNLNNNEKNWLERQKKRAEDILAFKPVIVKLENVEDFDVIRRCTDCYYANYDIFEILKAKKKSENNTIELTNEKQVEVFNYYCRKSKKILLKKEAINKIDSCSLDGDEKEILLEILFLFENNAEEISFSLTPYKFEKLSEMVTKQKKPLLIEQEKILPLLIYFIGDENLFENKKYFLKYIEKFSHFIKKRFKNDDYHDHSSYYYQYYCITFVSNINYASLDEYYQFVFKHLLSFLIDQNAEIILNTTLDIQYVNDNKFFIIGNNNKKYSCKSTYYEPIHENYVYYNHKYHV